MPGFTPAERDQARAAIREGRAPSCPHCGVTLSIQVIDPKAETAYVRKRLWLLCPRCKRTASIDAPR